MKSLLTESRDIAPSSIYSSSQRCTESIENGRLEFVVGSYLSVF